MTLGLSLVQCQLLTADYKEDLLALAAPLAIKTTGEDDMMKFAVFGPEKKFS